MKRSLVGCLVVTGQFITACEPSAPSSAPDAAGGLDSATMSGDSAAADNNSGPTSIITSFDPPEAAVGQILTVLGNFDFPPGLNSLMIGGQVISPSGFRPDSNNLKLSVIIPVAIAPPLGGQDIKVNVVTSAGTDEKGYRVFPAVATDPSPSIASIVNESNNGSLLLVGQNAKMTGSGFASAAANNTLVFKTTVGASTYTVPVTDFDLASSDSEHLVFTVPPLQGLNTGVTGPAIIEVSVGTSIPEPKLVTVFQP